MHFCCLLFIRHGRGIHSPTQIKACDAGSRSDLGNDRLVWLDQGDVPRNRRAIRHNLLEYAELMLFLLVAMTYINAMDERNVFASLRSWLVNKDFSLRQLFWITGVLSFFISPIADNLTTALLMCAVVMAVGGTNVRFISIACINIVVAANAGGAFSPFGDITTLMV